MRFLLGAEVLSRRRRRAPRFLSRASGQSPGAEERRESSPSIRRASGAARDRLDTTGVFIPPPKIEDVLREASTLINPAEFQRRMGAVPEDGVGQYPFPWPPLGPALEEAAAFREEALFPEGLPTARSGPPRPPARSAAEPPARMNTPGAGRREEARSGRTARRLRGGGRTGDEEGRDESPSAEKAVPRRKRGPRERDRLGRRAARGTSRAERRRGTLSSRMRRPAYRWGSWRARMA